MQNTKEFLVVEVYEEDDTEFDGEHQTFLWDVQTEEIIMEGDYYHNKIDYQIRGFFEALDYIKIDYVRTTERTNDDTYFHRFTR